MRLSCLALIVLLTGAARGDEKPEPPKPSSHTTRDVEGWTVHVDDRLLSGPDQALGERSLRLLSCRLFDIKLLLPPDKVARLQEVPIWLDLTHGKLSSMQYHPSAGWLKGNGYDPKLAKCVHIPKASGFADVGHQRVQPWSVLHELAHAYHDQVLGFDHAEIKAAWQKARDAGKYQRVLHIDGRETRHYALTDQKEFFAEMTEAFFGVNDFFPFNRAELHRDAPEVYRLLQRVWNSPSRADRVAE